MLTAKTEEDWLEYTDTDDVSGDKSLGDNFLTYKRDLIRLQYILEKHISNLLISIQ